MTELSVNTPNGTDRNNEYRYVKNVLDKNTPILDEVILHATMGNRNYAWDAAGNLDSIDASGNPINFEFDEEGRMELAQRALASEKVDLTYDGRSFLKSAAQTAGGTDTLEALYDSGGLLHRLVVADTSGSLSLSAMQRTMAEGHLFTGLPSASSPPSPTDGSDPDGGDPLDGGGAEAERACFGSSIDSKVK